MLIVFGGLPGTGKTTISRAVSAALAATYLRIDAIEQALRDGGVPGGQVGSCGYAVAQAVAAGNLANGQSVVADCVNPVLASREGWRAVAARTATRLLEVEVVCSDTAEHLRRVTTRSADIAGLLSPSWESVLTHEYEAWDRSHLVVDSAIVSAAEAVTLVLKEAS